MLALVKTPSGTAPVEIREVPEPIPAANEALVEVRAFSLNRGELRLMQIRAEGWRPGQDISGVVLRQAADGGGAAAGTRVVALTDNAGWAQRAAVPAHRLAALADNVRFRDFAEHPNARIQSFSYFSSEAEERFAPDLALLASLVGAGSLKLALVESSWRDVAEIGPQLRDRRIAGKAVFRVDQS